MGASFFPGVDPEHGVLTHYFGDAPEEIETTTAVRSALGEMARLGAEIVEVAIPWFDGTISETSVIEFEFKWDLADYLARTSGAPVRSLTEVVEGGLHHEAVTGVFQRGTP